MLNNQSPSNRAMKKTTEATGDLIGNKIANNITKKLPKNTSENVERETEIPKEIYTYMPRGKRVNYWWIKINDIIMNIKKW